MKIDNFMRENVAFTLIFPGNVRNAINCDFYKLRHLRPFSLSKKIFVFPKIVISQFEVIL